jgi:hypothetical protein
MVTPESQIRGDEDVPDQLAARTLALTPVTEQTAELIKSTAEGLWDVASTILTTGIATASDWEEARAIASRLMAALERPPAPRPHPLASRLN